MTLLDLFSSFLSLNSHLAWADFFWDHPMFAQEKWENTMRFIRLALALGGGLFLIYEARARKLGEPLRNRTLKWVVYSVTALAFLAYFRFLQRTHALQGILPSTRALPLLLGLEVQRRGGLRTSL
ncbi:MAG: hypothetical protein QM784_32645 [Polyangiaceae bacterium]